MSQSLSSDAPNPGPQMWVHSLMASFPSCHFFLLLSTMSILLLTFPGKILFIAEPSNWAILNRFSDTSIILFGIGAYKDFTFINIFYKTQFYMFCSHNKKTRGGVLVLVHREWFDGTADLLIHEHDLLYPCQGLGLRDSPSTAKNCLLWLWYLEQHFSNSY